VVTGSSGHLGEALTWMLRTDGHDVVGVDIRPDGSTDLVGSIADRTFVRSVLSGADAVIHTATLHKPHVDTHSRQEFVDTNISGTLTLLEESAAAGIGRFIFTSTTSSFGRALTPGAGAPAAWITEDVQPQPRNIYGASKIAAEFAAGVKNFDVFIGGSGTYESLVESGMTEPLDAMMILPEVKEAKNWWGGHIWEDNVSTNRFLYSFIADAGTGGFWYNTKMLKPDEIHSLDDLLKPQWKGKVGFLDPRTPGSGQSIWSFLWDIKGESYLKKLVQQDLFISRDQRQLGDALAKGKLAVALGVSFYTLEGFLTANLPIK